MKLYSLKEAAEILGVSVRSIYYWRAKGKIEFVKVGGRNKLSEETIKKIMQVGI